MKISFVIPLHNEEKNARSSVERVISYCSRKRWNFEVIPVDDRSTDTTREVLQRLAKEQSVVKPVYRKQNQQQAGNTMGRALVEGTKRAKGTIIIWTMGDLADDRKTFGELIEKINDGHDMVFGSRYMTGGSRGNLEPLKAFLSSWGTILARLLFGIKVHDITNAFRAFKKEVFDTVPLTSDGFSISPEFAIRAHLAGFTLGEVPTTYTNRKEGVSSFKLLRMTRSYLQLYSTLFLESRGVLRKNTHTYSKASEKSSHLYE